MIFFVPVQNMNPQLGPVNGNKQAVSVYDRQLGNKRTVITTPEEADEFVKDRAEVLKHANKQGLVDALGIAVLGSGIGAGVSGAVEAHSAKKLQKMVDKLNPMYQELLKNKENEFNLNNRLNRKFMPGRMYYDELLQKEPFKKNSLKLSNLFDENAQLFKNVNMKPILKEAGIIGACIGGIIGLIIGSVVGTAKVENADKKITNEFIDANK